MSAARQLQPAPAPKVFTFEEYLLWEEAQEERHEYLNGTVVDMAGASEDHEIVAGNLFAEILMHLRGKGCRVFKGGMKLRIKAGSVDLSYYPDVMVVCDPADDLPACKERPRLIAEVMTSFRQDHFEKMFVYQQIESLEEYLIISQDAAKPEAWIYRRDAGWAMPDPITSGDIELASIGLRLSLETLYAS